MVVSVPEKCSEVKRDLFLVHLLMRQGKKHLKLCIVVCRANMSKTGDRTPLFVDDLTRNGSAFRFLFSDKAGHAFIIYQNAASKPSGGNHISASLLMQNGGFSTFSAYTTSEFSASRSSQVLYEVLRQKNFTGLR
jgi:hypothetical protein